MENSKNKKTATEIAVFVDDKIINGKNELPRSKLRGYPSYIIKSCRSILYYFYSLLNNPGPAFLDEMYKKRAGRERNRV